MGSGRALTRPLGVPTAARAALPGGSKTAPAASTRLRGRLAERLFNQPLHSRIANTTIVVINYIKWGNPLVWLVL